MARERIQSIAQQHQFCAELKTNLSYCYGSSSSSSAGTAVNTATASTVSVSSTPLPVASVPPSGDLETVVETDATAQDANNDAEEALENDANGGGGGGGGHFVHQPFCPVYMLNGE